LNQDYDTELREEGLKLLENIEKGDVQQVKNGYEQFLEEWNEAGMAKLATHVAHRKATLTLLRASLNLTEKGKYQLENAVHGLIFPLKKTSDDVRADQMNLWIVDEKLASTITSRLTSRLINCGTTRLHWIVLTDLIY